MSQVNGIDVSRLPTRLQDKIAMHPDGCWLWTATVVDGRGRVWDSSRGEVVPAYRAIYELLVGPIPDGRILHHVCEAPLCVNPAHLVPLTRREHAAEHGLAGAAALHAVQTHCANGHPLDASRACAECSRRRARDWARKKRQDPAWRDRFNAYKRERRAAGLST